MEFKIALVGNPNVGKTSLYNNLTHSAEHVGNWHGVTVKDKSKTVLYNHNKTVITDLPGIYSLSVYSPEEGVTRDSVLSGEADVTVCVCEVNNLSRNLYLALQLLEMDAPLVVAINMMDELKKQGKALNYRKIEEALKVPIVPMSTKYHSDSHLLMEVCCDYVANKTKNEVKLPYLEKLPVNDFIEIIKPEAEREGLNPVYAAIKLMENDEFVVAKLSLDDKKTEALKNFGDLQAEVARVRYAFIDEITAGAISKPVTVEHSEMHEHSHHEIPLEGCGGDEGEASITDINLSTASKKDLKKAAKHKKLHDKRREEAKLYQHGFSKIDKVLLNKYAALPIFLLVMLAIFYLTFGLIGHWISYGLELGIEHGLYNPIQNGLNSINTPSWVVGLLCDGIISGLGGVLIFLPQVVLLFFFLALLEDSGYLSRVAFMTDGLFRKIGLSGRSVFTMLMGFGCSATAVMTARGLEDEKTRKKTILLTPFMSCSARLPVYAVIAAAFFAKGSALIIFAMYILGVLVSVLLAAIFERIKPLKSGKLSFIMEMPPYRLPTAKRVFHIIWHNIKAFLIRVGTVVFALNVAVWLLSSFSFTHGYVVGTDYRSIMEVVAGFIAPVFAPLGFGNWQAVTALISGIAAKEAVISSISGLGGVNAIFTGSYASLSALSFMVFTLLYIPCIATLVTIKKETNYKWMFGTLLLTTGIAYIFSLLFYWIGRAFIAAPGIAAGVLIVAVIALLLILIIVRIVKKKKTCPYGCEGCANSDGCEEKAVDGKKTVKEKK